MFYNALYCLNGKSVPATLQDTDIARLPKSAADWYRKFMAVALTPEFPEGVAPVIVGRSEAGKTRLAALIALTLEHGWLGDKFKVRWLSCPRDTAAWELQLRSGYEAVQRAREILVEWQTASILVIDEFQLCPPELLTQIIWPRSEAYLPTIMTGNLALSELNESLPELFGAASPGAMHRIGKMTDCGKWLIQLK